MENRKLNTKRESDGFENIADLASSLTKLGFRGIDISMDLARELTGKLNLGNNSKKNCGCHGNCICNDTKYMDELCGDCMPCGPGNSTTDMKIVGRLGEVRRLSFVIENNLNKPSNYNINVANLVDQCGNEVNSAKVIQVKEAKGTLKPCESTTVDLFVLFTAELKDSNVYYTEIVLDGECCSNKFSLGVWVQDNCLTDHLVLCDPCRPKKSEMLQFNNCNCCDDDGNIKEGKKYYRI